MITPLNYYLQIDTNARHSNGSCAIIIASRSDDTAFSKGIIQIDICLDCIR